MITGDKAETAQAIGRKCHLIGSGDAASKQEIFKIVNQTGEALRQKIMDLHERVILTRRRAVAEEHMRQSE